MRDLKEVARQSKAKAQKKLKKGKLRPEEEEPEDEDVEEEDDELEDAGEEAEDDEDEDEEDDEETVVLAPVRADGRPGSPREPLASRKATKKKKKAKVRRVDDEEPEDDEDAGGAFDPGAPEAVRKRAAKMRVAEVKGDGEMSAYAGGQDGDVPSIGKNGRQRSVQEAEAVLTTVQDKKLKRARLFLKGATIVDVVIDLQYGTTTALVIKPAKSKTAVKIPVKVSESGQVFLKVPK